ncbi:MAG: putative peptidase family [Clostridiales bacterium]|jgi:predicted Zn-dependent peptidase|nr:putative peptidase family [Clostridiales bacterium]
MKQIEINKTILPNGLKLVTSYKEGELFSLGIGVKIGSLYEEENKSGISHMIEHMLFKGTSNRDRDKLSDDIEKLAGDFDIYTSYNETVLTIDTMKKYAKSSLEIVSDMFMNAKFPEKEFRLEKKVIIEEIKMTKDDPEDWSYLSLYKTIYPEKWHKYHIAGTVKSVKGLKINMLKEFYKSYYVPNNTVISIVSSFTHEEVLKLVNRFFSSWQEKPVEELVEESINFLPNKVIRHKKGIGQVHLLYAFDIQCLSKKEEIILTLLNEKIGAGANSILFKELRDKRGYAYSLYSDIDFIKNLKMFYIYAGISEENLKDTIMVVDSIILKIMNKEIVINEESINLLKEIFYINTAIRLEGSSYIVDYMLDGEMSYGNPEEYKKSLEIIKEISVEDVSLVIDKVFKKPIVHVLLPMD